MVLDRRSLLRGFAMTALGRAAPARLALAAAPIDNRLAIVILRGARILPFRRRVSPAAPSISMAISVCIRRWRRSWKCIKPARC